MKSSICLIRHGITEGNLRRLYYGHTDIPLANIGVDELVKLAEAGTYPVSDSADFYTTGLIRTEQTFFLIYGNKEHDRIEELREINFGDFEMKSYEELKEIPEYITWIEDKSGQLRTPEGESIREFVERITGGFAELRKRHALKELSMRHKEEEALSIVVCHGGTIAAIMENVFPGEKDNFFMWTPEPGHGYILKLENGKIVGSEAF